MARMLVHGRVVVVQLRGLMLLEVLLLEVLVRVGRHQVHASARTAHSVDLVGAEVEIQAVHALLGAETAPRQVLVALDAGLFALGTAWRC